MIFRLYPRPSLCPRLSLSSFISSRSAFVGNPSSLFLFLSFFLCLSFFLPNQFWRLGPLFLCWLVHSSCFCLVCSVPRTVRWVLTWWAFLVSLYEHTFLYVPYLYSTIHHTYTKSDYDFSVSDTMLGVCIDVGKSLFHSDKQDSKRFVFFGPFFDLFLFLFPIILFQKCKVKIQ